MSEAKSNDEGVVMKTRTYVRIRQNGPDIFDLKKITEYIEQHPKSDAFEIIETNEQPVALWGTGVFGVDAEGKLYCVAANWDTSD
jgi:hypothetical protein